MKRGTISFKGTVGELRALLLSQENREAVRSVTGYQDIRLSDARWVPSKEAQTVA